MAVYTVQYAKHSTLAPLEVDVIHMASEGRDASTQIVIANRGLVPLFFDLTYYDGRLPRDDIAPYEDDLFIVAPNYAMQTTLPFTIHGASLVAEEAVAYSVMLLG